MPTPASPAVTHTVTARTDLRMAQTIADAVVLSSFMAENVGSVGEPAAMVMRQSVRWPSDGGASRRARAVMIWRDRSYERVSRAFICV